MIELFCSSALVTAEVDRTPPVEWTTPVPIPAIAIFPVVFPPIVKVLFLSDWIVELAASNTNPFPFVEADSVAIGVPLAMPFTANKAEEVDCPPTARSTVGLIAKRSPFTWFQYDTVPAGQLVPLTRQTDWPLTITSLAA